MKPLASLDRAEARARSRSRTAKRASLTSDQTRGRDMAVAALAAAAAALIAILASDGARTPGALARPHREAKLACAACHTGDAARLASGEPCKECHGASAHASTRPAHRALAARGAMSCVTCHPAHGDAQGVTLAGDGRALRWIGEREEIAPVVAPPALRATVPLVAARACARCHDPASARDPLAACLTAPNATIATCFDEHQREGAAPAARGTGALACARQHEPSRFVAWDVARAVATAPTGPALAPRRSLAPLLWVVAGLAAAAGTSALLAIWRSRRRRAPAPANAAPLVAAPRVRLPVIDPSTCLGCYACVDACPFDVLEIRRYAAVVARPDDCCGVILCAQACPNGSLRIDEQGAAPNRPRVDAHLESLDAKGVFLAGDLTGLPLIKNAIHQGTRAVDRIAVTLSRAERAARGHDADLLVIGAGPAGIAAMLRAKERGLRAICLEQGALAASIRSFPRNKIVYDPPLDLPLEGALWMREATKEELIAQWSRIARGHALDIREERRVDRIDRTDGPSFAVSASRADGTRETFRAPRLLLAIGRRGTPRALPVATSGERAAAKISYALADARTFAGAHVLIVGLGDVAMEAAIAVARQPDAVVTVSYRGAGFTRGKARTLAELRALVAAGRVRIVFESRLERVDRATATLRIGSDGSRIESIPNDAVLVLIGGVPSWDLVHAAGVRLENASISPEIATGENLSPARTYEGP